MDVTWGKFLALAATSGALAGAANQGFRFFHDWVADRRKKATQEREREHQRSMQTDEREHQEKLRREAAFAEARKELLHLAVEVSSWIDWYWGKAYGEDADYHQPRLPDEAQVRDARAAIHALKQVSGLHPAKSVRDFADGLRVAIDNTVNFDVYFDESGDQVPPSEDSLERWYRMSNELIEAMHDPDYQPVDPVKA